MGEKMRILITVFLAFLSQMAIAGDAGCGLGSVVISKNSKGLQLLALTTNGTFSSQLFGITSGTSNCSSSGLVKNDKEVQYFVEVNQSDLTREMAQGQGEKLSTLASLHGCSSPEAKQAFAEMTKSSYLQIIPTAETDSAELISNLNSQIKASANVSQLCNVAKL